MDRRRISLVHLDSDLCPDGSTNNSLSLWFRLRNLKLSDLTIIPLFSFLKSIRLYPNNSFGRNRKHRFAISYACYYQNNRHAPEQVAPRALSKFLPREGWGEGCTGSSMTRRPKPMPRIPKKHYHFIPKIGNVGPLDLWLNRLFRLLLKV